MDSNGGSRVVSGTSTVSTTSGSTVEPVDDSLNGQGSSTTDTLNGESTTATANSTTSPVRSGPSASSYLLEDPKLKDILLSDVGSESLLARLKQSVVAAKELATFAKKSAVLESDSLSAVRKLARNTRESIKKPESRQGTYARQLDEIVKLNERACDVGNSYVAALHIMHDELTELAKAVDRSRKSIKETSLRNEKSLLEAEQTAEKAKSKYEGLCDELDKMRTGDPSKTKFGFKHSRTPQHEEELQKKVLAAETEYQQRVDAAQRARQDQINKSRPAVVKQIKDLVLECDSGICLQLQKYANLQETLVLNRGFIVAPIKPKGAANANLTLKEVAANVDNELDLYNYVLGVPKTTKRALNRPGVTFRRHPVMGNSYTASVSQPSTTVPTPRQASVASTVGTVGTTSNVGGAPRTLPPPVSSTSIAAASIAPSTPSGTPGLGSTSVFSEPSANQDSSGEKSFTSPGLASLNPTFASSSTAPSQDNFPPGTTRHHLPSFGTPLDVLLDMEEAGVPRVVFECIQAVDHFGLEIEGIYRTNGNASQVADLKSLFDKDATAVDLLHPPAHLNDIHSVASVLKQYFRDLPDPLLTREFHTEFLSAAKVPDDAQRRDAIHGVINKLPDPNYATLRYLVFHLYRVQEREASNRMSIGNLATIWGPTLMATDYSNVAELAVQTQIIETILSNAYVIFDAE